jgi:hypothetical protein
MECVAPALLQSIREITEFLFWNRDVWREDETRPGSESIVKCSERRADVELDSLHRR